jgi:uncharacterized protein YndB with AHSA1/START domain
LPASNFHAITSATPDCVWDALAATCVPLDYLHGMTADTDWQPGARVTLARTDQWRLTGEVLAAGQPRRLSYTLDDPPGSPAVLAEGLGPRPGCWPGVAGYRLAWWA